jgi:large subunit ribosomal protein L4
VLEDLSFEAPKTKEMVNVLNALAINNKVLIVTVDENKAVELSARNIPGVTVVTATGLNVLDIVNHDKIVITKEAAEKAGEVLV